MTVYVDEIRVYPKSIMDAATKRNGVRWCHMLADTIEELHLMADTIGIQRRYFQNHGSIPHYDITPPKRAKALRAGAIFKSAREQARERIEARKKGK